MRIGFDAKRLFTNFTGLGNYSRNLVASLADHFPQHQYFLYTPELSDHNQTAFFQDSSKYTIRQPRFGSGSFWRSMGVKRILEQDELDIFHGLSHEIPFNLQSTSFKTVVTIHDLIFKIFPDQYPLIQRQIYDFKCRYACKNADAIIAISEHTKADIIRSYSIDPNKISVIYQSCDPVFQMEQVNTSFDHLELPSNFLLYVGSIIERKNLLNVVRALKHLPDDLQLPLLVVGRGKSYEQLVRRYLEAHQLQELVIFKPDINLQELAHLYHSAEMLLYPSEYEGFGIPVIEALSCGTAVITSTSSALPEAGGPAAHYIEAEDPEAIGKGIEKLLTDTTYRDSLIQKGKRHVKQFDRKKLAEQMEQLYQNLLAQ